MTKRELNKAVKGARRTLGDVFSLVNKMEVMLVLLAKELGNIDRSLTDRKTRLSKK